MTVRILRGDVRDRLKDMADESVHCVVTSPPYWGLRDYGHEGQIGLEDSPDEFVGELVAVFREVRRVLRGDGTCWLNLGDSYNGYMANQRATSISAANQSSRPAFESGRGKRTASLRAKDMVGVPWRVAFALQADGWCLRQDIIWHKPNPMPESVRDRCTKAHEYIFLLSKSERYYYDAKAIAEESIYKAGEGGHQSFGKPGGKAEIAYGSMVSGDKWDSDGTRNKRSVWSVNTHAFPEAHFATFPPALIEPCILAGCPVGGTVLDPFGGAGTTGLVSDRLQRDAILIELNPEYADMAERRIRGDAPLFAQVGS